MRIGAVPGQDHDERLVRRGVLLDVDLAGRDVDDVAGVRPPSRARCPSGPTCSGPSPRGCRSRSRNRRGGGCGSSRRVRSTRGPCTAPRRRPSGARSRWSAPCRGADPRSCAGRRGRCAWPSPDDRPLPSGHVRPRAGDPALSAVRCALAARSAARLSAALGGRTEIWVKREDLLPLAFGGNKLRNLEFLVGAALADGADTLVTSGRRWSNHCRLTAAAGAAAGLAVELVLSGPPASVPGPGVRLMQSFGATVHQLPSADRAAREAEVARVAAGGRRAGRTAVRDRRGGLGGPRGATASRSRVTSCSTRPKRSASPWIASSCRRRRAGRRPG